jgi:hypothetical protein
MKYLDNLDNQSLSVGDKHVAYLRFTAVTLTRTLRVIKAYTLKVRVVICEAQSAAYHLPAHISSPDYIKIACDISYRLCNWKAA